MKTLLLFLAPLLSLAQNPNIPAAISITGYRGNPVAYTIVNGIPDTTSTLIARAQAYTRQNLPESQYPIVSRRSKDILLSWSGTQSTVLPQTGYVEVIVAGQVRYAGPVSITREPVAGRPNSTTVNAFILGSTAGLLPESQYAAGVQAQSSRDAGQDTQIGARVLQSTYNVDKQNTTLSLAQKASQGAFEQYQQEQALRNQTYATETMPLQFSTYQAMITALAGRTKPATIQVDHDDGPNGLLRDGAYLPRVYFYNGTTFTPSK